MEYIEFLGTCGTKSYDAGAFCVRVGKHTVIDAGNLIEGMKESVAKIRNIFLSHAHFDHLCDIPFLIEEILTTSTTPVTIYALRETIDVLQHSIFNNEVWPDFSQIKLLEGEKNTLEYRIIELDREYRIDGVSLVPVKTNHTKGSCGYIVRKRDHGILVTADTYRCESIWKQLDRFPWIHSLCIDISFSSDYADLARVSRHLTPQLLSEELKKTSRNDFAIYPIHLKPYFYKKIQKELDDFGLLRTGASKILLDGDRIYFDPERGTSHYYGELNKYQTLSELTKVSVALSNEKKIDALLELILTEVRKLTHAEGGSFYRLNHQEATLEFKVVQNDALGLRMGGAGEAIHWKPLPLYQDDGTENAHMVAVVAVLKGRTIAIDDVYRCQAFDFSGTRAFDSRTGYRSRSMLVIPFKNHRDEIIGVLQLINKRDRDGEIIPFGSQDEKIVEALASEAAIALTRQQLIDELETLFESFLQSINIAIEQKSAYTAGHVERVVTITEMLIRAIDADQGVFREKHYDEDAFREIRLAALMHDVGKIAIPEYIMDKATKLQTLYDRIHAIHLKGEIRKRELEIRRLKASSDRPEVSPEKSRNDPYAKECEAVERELSFLDEVNLGRERLDRKKIDRIRSIAKATIHLDGKRQHWLSNDEVMNLTIPRGTLNPQEKEIIKRHAYITREILEALPFPKKFSRIPEIAASHHEQLNGEGYPLGLKGDEISFEARVLAIADIFEALTASDRPYKRAKKLSEAMRILYAMAKENRIDIDIVEFLYRSGLYKKIAEKLLPQRLIDECRLDIDRA